MVQVLGILITSCCAYYFQGNASYCQYFFNDFLNVLRETAFICNKGESHVCHANVGKETNFIVLLTSCELGVLHHFACNCTRILKNDTQLCLATVRKAFEVKLFGSWCPFYWTLLIAQMWCFEASAHFFWNIKHRKMMNVFCLITPETEKISLFATTPCGFWVETWFGSNFEFLVRPQMSPYQIWQVKLPNRAFSHRSANGRPIYS